MKKLFLLLAVVALAFTACDKENGDSKFSLKGQWVMDQLNESDIAKFKMGYDFSVTMAGKATVFMIVEESKHDLIQKGEYYSSGVYADYVENFSSEGELIGITITSLDEENIRIEVLDNNTIVLTEDDGAAMTFKRVATKPLLELPKLVE